MNFSLDTNVVISLMNTKHPLHEKSINLMNEKRNETLFLSRTVLKESQTVLRTKINEIMAEFIRFLPNSLELSKLGSFKLKSLLIEEFKQIIDKKPKLTDFVNLIYDEIDIFLKDNSIERLPTFLSELSMRYSRISVQKKLEEIHHISDMILLNRDNLSAVRKAITEIYFENPTDERIFLEMMTNLNYIKPIELFSNDTEFAKKCENGYTKVTTNLGFDNHAFSIIII